MTPRRFDSQEGRQKDAFVSSAVGSSNSRLREEEARLRRLVATTNAMICAMERRGLRPHLPEGWKRIPRNAGRDELGRVVGVARELLDRLSGSGER
jgi:hypothetical protein